MRPAAAHGVEVKNPRLVEMLEEVAREDLEAALAAVHDGRKDDALAVLERVVAKIDTALDLARQGEAPSPPKSPW